MYITKNIYIVLILIIIMCFKYLLYIILEKKFEREI